MNTWYMLISILCPENIINKEDQNHYSYPKDKDKALNRSQWDADTMVMYIKDLKLNEHFLLIFQYWVLCYGKIKWTMIESETLEMTDLCGS